MSKCLHIVESGGIPFTMRLVENGEPYGKDMCLTHDQDDPLVEFYDRRFPFEDEPSNGMSLGQYVSRYYLSTLMEPDRSGKTAFDAGLNLEGSVDAWTLDAAAMRSCQHALMAAGATPSPEGKKAGYLLVMAEPPMVGLDPHPAYAPNIETWPFHENGMTEVWAEVYHLNTSELSAGQEAMEDHQAALEAVEIGDMEDTGPADEVMPVFVTEDGAIEFVDFQTGDIMIRHEMADIFEEGFGMTPPDMTLPSTPEC